MGLIILLPTKRKLSEEESPCADRVMRRGAVCKLVQRRQQGRLLHQRWVPPAVQEPRPPLRQQVLAGHLLALTRFFKSTARRQGCYGSLTLHACLKVQDVSTHALCTCQLLHS